MDQILKIPRTGLVISLYRRSPIPHLIPLKEQTYLICADTDIPCGEHNVLFYPYLVRARAKIGISHEIRFNNGNIVYDGERLSLDRVTNLSKYMGFYTPIDCIKYMTAYQEPQTLIEVSVLDMKGFRKRTPDIVKKSFPIEHRFPMLLTRGVRRELREYVRLNKEP